MEFSFAVVVFVSPWLYCLFIFVLVYWSLNIRTYPSLLSTLLVHGAYLRYVVYGGFPYIFIFSPSLYLWLGYLIFCFYGWIYVLYHHCFLASVFYLWHTFGVVLFINGWILCWLHHFILILSTHAPYSSFLLLLWWYYYVYGFMLGSFCFIVWHPYLHMPPCSLTIWWYYLYGFYGWILPISFMFRFPLIPSYWRLYLSPFFLVSI